MSDEVRRIAFHEAGHLVAAWSFGYRPGESTILRGEQMAGCAYTYRWRPEGPLPDLGLPLSLWAGRWQRWAAGEAILLQAGDVAEHLFARRTGRMPEPVALAAVEQAAVLTEALPVTPAERERLTEAVSSPEAITDADQLARLVLFCHGHDLHASSAWLDWTGEECLRLLVLYSERVERMAALLAAEGMVGAEAAARVLAC